jgi:hypothetical protein
LLSGIIFTMRRLNTFTWSPPIRPAMRKPLNTRDGHDDPPNEPGALPRLC